MFEIFPISFHKNEKYNKDYKYFCYIIYYIVLLFIIIWYTLYRGF